jgi:hypothetical protein
MILELVKLEWFSQVAHFVSILPSILLHSLTSLRQICRYACLFVSVCVRDIWW